MGYPSRHATYFKSWAATYADVYMRNLLEFAIYIFAIQLCFVYVALRSKYSRGHSWKFIESIPVEIFLKLSFINNHTYLFLICTWNISSGCSCVGGSGKFRVAGFTFATSLRHSADEKLAVAHEIYLLRLRVLSRIGSCTSLGFTWSRATRRIPFIGDDR